MTHRINRLRFELASTDLEQAFELRTHAEHVLQQEIADSVDAVCSRNSQDEEWLYIDKIEIDLGRLSPNAIRTEFIQVFLDRFEQALVKKIGELRPERSRVSLAASGLELVCHFLLHGALPWWASEGETDFDTIVETVLAKAPDQIRAFLDIHRQNQAVWSRVAFQLPSNAQQTIVALFAELARAETELRAWISNHPMESVVPVPDEEYSRVILQHASEILVDSNSVIVVARIGEAILSSAPSVSMERQANIQPGAENNFEDTPSPLLSSEEASIEQPKSYDLEKKRITPIESPASQEELTANSTNKSVSSNEPTSHMEEGRRIDDPFIASSHEGFESSEERYVVQQAGIVILAPFFGKFFDACGLLDKEGSHWKDKASQHQAVHLLHYLATGHTSVPEYALVLEKLCCGMSIDEPTVRHVSFTDSQLHESASLLNAVIQHWKALKNTSIDGLRETFLKREGLLTRTDDAWLLRVERKSFDVLMDTIPWGFSTIALPWNEYIVHVEW